MILKAYDRCGKQVTFSSSSGDSKGKAQPDRQLGTNADAYAEPMRFEATPVPARALATAAEVVTAGLACAPLMCRTQFGNERYDAVLEYPFKTVNLNQRHGIFQPDTGPVLFPDLSVEPDQLLASVEMAFVAWNAYPGSATTDEGVAEFLVRVPTDIGSSESGERMRTLHYSKSVRFPARHAVFALD